MSLIDRQAAIDELTIEYMARGMLGEKWAVERCIDAIKNLPSAQEWIPVTERLPEMHKDPYYVGFDEELYDSDWVLVCCKGYNEYVYTVSQVIYSKEPDGFATEWHGLYDYAEQEIDDRDVIAWMELPEPYEGGEE